MRAPPIYLSLVVALTAACADQEPIGTTTWAVRTSPGIVRVSSNGRIIAGSYNFVAELDRDGAELWRQTMQYNDSFDVDSAGNVYVARSEGVAGKRFYRLSAADGTTQWRIDVGPVDTVGTVVVGADDVVWYFTRQDLQSSWTQYTTSGAVIATGTLGFPVGQPVALPDGGLLVAGLRTVDKTGSVTWMGDDSAAMFALHDDGEITALVSTELVRYAADHQVRWRHRIDMPATLRSVGKRLLVGSYTDVGSEIELFDDDGASTAHERFSAQVSLEASWGDGYLLAFYSMQSLDLHDRVVPFEGVPGEVLAGLAARRLP
jgi:hypothetical protein